MHTLKNLVALVVVLSFSAFGGEPLKLFPGWPTLRPGVTRATSADPAIAEVSLTPRGAKITGKKPGKTTVKLARQGASAEETVAVEITTAGFPMVPVVAFVLDVEPGTVVTEAMVERRELPEQFVNANVVKPDSASYLIGQRVLVPVTSSDLALWSAFETTKLNQK